ncbi:glycosyltransferase family 4 protein, partial [Aerococcus viridans]
VGIDFNKIQASLNKNNKERLREKLKISADSKIMISVGELNNNKNHIAGIEALNIMQDDALHYVICGIGTQESYLRTKVSEYKLENNVHFIGYTHNIEEYLSGSDFSLFLSKREGLGLAGLEAMAAGLPLISSNIGGIKDYTNNGETGFTVDDPGDYEIIAKQINNLLNLENKQLKKISKNNQRIAEKYSSELVNKEMYEIYSELF